MIAHCLAFKQSFEAAGLSFDFDRDGRSCVFIDLVLSLINHWWECLDKTIGCDIIIICRYVLIIVLQHRICNQARSVWEARRAGPPCVLPGPLLFACGGLSSTLAPPHGSDGPLLQNCHATGLYVTAISGCNLYIYNYISCISIVVGL